MPPPSSMATLLSSDAFNHKKTNDWSIEIDGDDNYRQLYKKKYKRGK